MNPHGRPARPGRRLADAAIDYAAAVESELPGDVKRAYDRLRMSAIRYRDSRERGMGPGRRAGSVDNVKRKRGSGSWQVAGVRTARGLA
jgi:hypothetical protein